MKNNCTYEKQEKIDAIIRYIKNYDYENLRTLMFPKEDAVVLLEVLSNYINPWIPYNGKMIEEGEYMITVTDDIAKDKHMKVRLANYYEKSGAFQGYGIGPRCKVLAYKKKDEPFVFAKESVGKAVFNISEEYESMYSRNGETVDILYEMNSAPYEYDEKSYMIRFFDGYTMPVEEFYLTNIELYKGKDDCEREE